MKGKSVICEIFISTCIDMKAFQNFINKSNDNERRAQKKNALKDQFQSIHKKEIAPNYYHITSFNASYRKLLNA